MCFLLHKDGKSIKCVECKKTIYLSTKNRGKLSSNDLLETDCGYCIIDSSKEEAAIAIIRAAIWKHDATRCIVVWFIITMVLLIAHILRFFI